MNLLVWELLGQLNAYFMVRDFFAGEYFLSGFGLAMTLWAAKVYTNVKREKKRR